MEVLRHRGITESDRTDDTRQRSLRHHHQDSPHFFLFVPFAFSRKIPFGKYNITKLLCIDIRKSTYVHNRKSYMFKTMFV